MTRALVIAAAVAVGGAVAAIGAACVAVAWTAPDVFDVELAAHPRGAAA